MVGPRKKIFCTHHLLPILHLHSGYSNQISKREEAWSQDMNQPDLDLCPLELQSNPKSHLHPYPLKSDYSQMSPPPDNQSHRPHPYRLTTGYSGPEILLNYLIHQHPHPRRNHPHRNQAHVLLPTNQAWNHHHGLPIADYLTAHAQMAINPF